MSKKPAIPNHRDAFLKRWPSFARWLIAGGSQVLVPTNEYELARFTTPEGVGIVYQDKGGWIKAEHWRGGALDAWKAFVYNGSWRAVARTGKVGKEKLDRLTRAIIERDGDICFYCREEFSEARPATREHFVAATHGGPNHLSNMALAHLDCNNEVGHMSVAEKIAYAHRRWLEHAVLHSKEKPHEPVLDRGHNESIERVDSLDPGRPEPAGMPV